MKEESYLKGYGYVHDFHFHELCEKFNKTEDEIIEEMVNTGWSIGQDEFGHNEYWENETNKTKEIK